MLKRKRTDSNIDCRNHHVDYDTNEVRTQLQTLQQKPFMSIMQDKMRTPLTACTPVVSMHVPVYQRRDTIYQLEYLFRLNVPSAHFVQQDWHMRHSACVVVMDENQNHYCVFGSNKIQSFSFKRDLFGHFKYASIPPPCNEITDDMCIVQNMTSIIVCCEKEARYCKHCTHCTHCTGENHIVCPVFDHEMTFYKQVQQHQMFPYMRAVALLQHDLFKKAFSHISNVEPKH